MRTSSAFLLVILLVAAGIAIGVLLQQTSPQLKLLLSPVLFFIAFLVFYFGDRKKSRTEDHGR